MNIAILVGNLGGDPELNTTKSGTSVANFSLATSVRVNGEDKTSWHRVTVWGDQAESVAKYLSKGSKAGVEGRIEYSTYEDTNGNTRYSTSIVANRVEFLNSKGSKTQAEDDPF